MLKNYLKTAIRNLKRNKVYTLLNTLGLAMGIGCALVIFDVIRYEYSFDKHQENYDKIYRINNQSIYPDRVAKGMGTPHPVAAAAKEDFPEIEKIVRTHYVYGDQINIRKPNGEMDKFLIEEGVVFTENSFFDVFTTEWLSGDKSSALTKPETCVITTGKARQLFGLKEGQEHEAIGKQINYNNLIDIEVVGLIGDPVETTNFPFEILVEYEAQDTINPYYNGGTSFNSTSSNTNTYFIPSGGFDPAAFDTKMVDFVEKHHGEGESDERRYVCQPLSEIHFDQEYGAYTNSISVSFLYGLGVIGIFLILTACINFVNLATAQAANRSKEIGIRKAIGSMRRQLVAQFMAEIAVITFTSVVLSLAVAELMFISLEGVIGYRLSVNLFGDPMITVFLLVLFVVVTVLSGFYPSVLLSRMNTVMALKSKITSEKHTGGLSLRKGLVITQFAISQFLIIGTLIITAQMNFFNSQDLGFETDAIVTTYLPVRDQTVNERFRNLMTASPLISDLSFSLSQPTGSSNSHSNFDYEPLKSEISYNATFKVSDHRYHEFYDLTLLGGRSIRKGDSANLIVVNRRIADLMGFKDDYESAVGEQLNTGWGGDKQIIGVIENFETSSLNTPLDEQARYIIMIQDPRVYYSIQFKVANTQNLKAAMDHFRDTWETVYPKYVNDYDFFDEELAERYEYEQRVSDLLRIFAVISIVIGCLGLYGLISFVAINKTKEIGVRKVLGASVTSILAIFTKEIVVLMGVAFLVAGPLAYFTLNEWLNTYAHRIDIGFSFFAIAFAITLVIAMITISHRTVSSAMLNPARTLKDE